VVASVVAVVVVDQLEVIEIDHQQAERLPLAAGAGELVVHQLADVALVEDLGDRVGMRQRFEPT